MRQLFRQFVTGVWTITFVIFAFTLETVADALGWTAAVKAFVAHGWRGMTDAGYQSMVVGLFVFLSGAMVAVWTEYGLRRWEERRRVQNWAHFRVEFTDDRNQIDKRVGVDAITMLDGQVLGNIYTSDPKISKSVITLIVQFKAEIVEPCPYVASDRKMIWREVRAGDHYLVLEIDRLTKEDVLFEVIARPRKWQGGEKFDSALKWHDASVLPR